MQNWQESLVQVQKFVLYFCNTHLTSVDQDCGELRLKVIFSRHDTSSDFNGLFPNIGIPGMLEGEIKHVRHVAPFSICVIFRGTGLVGNAATKRLHTTYPHLVHPLTYCKRVG